MWIVERMRYRPTNRPTDTASYRGSLSHLKNKKKNQKTKKHFRCFLGSCQCRVVYISDPLHTSVCPPPTPQGFQAKISICWQKSTGVGPNPRLLTQISALDPYFSLLAQIQPVGPIPSNLDKHACLFYSQHASMRQQQQGKEMNTSTKCF